VRMRELTGNKPRTLQTPIRGTHPMRGRETPPRGSQSLRRTSVSQSVSRARAKAGDDRSSAAGDTTASGARRRQAFCTPTIVGDGVD